MLKKFLIICPVCYHTSELYCEETYPDVKHVCPNCEHKLVGWKEITPNVSDTKARDPTDVDQELVDEVFNGYPKGHKYADDGLTNKEV